MTNFSFWLLNACFCFPWWGVFGFDWTSCFFTMAQKNSRLKSDMLLLYPQCTTKGRCALDGCHREEPFTINCFSRHLPPHDKQLMCLHTISDLAQGKWFVPKYSEMSIGGFCSEGEKRASRVLTKLVQFFTPHTAAGYKVYSWHQIPQSGRASR